MIDDESDYFSVDNRWLSDDHRRLLKDREDRLREEHRGAHRKTKLTLDIAGRRVIEEEEQFGESRTNPTILPLCLYLS